MYMCTAPIDASSSWHFILCLRSYVQLRPTSIEKEIFPVMAEEGQLYAMELQGNYYCNTATQFSFTQMSSSVAVTKSASVMFLCNFKWID